jgi:hypothetical protein
MSTHRKIIQIATAATANNKSAPVLHAVCDDGSVWMHTHEGIWYRLDTTMVEQSPPLCPPPPPSFDGVFKGIL